MCFRPRHRVSAAANFCSCFFDGGHAVDGHTLHAERPAFLSHSKGSMQLAATGRPVDRVAWGRGRPGGVNLGRGGVPTNRSRREYHRYRECPQSKGRCRRSQFRIATVHRSLHPPLRATAPEPGR